MLLGFFVTGRTTVSFCLRTSSRILACVIGAASTVVAVPLLLIIGRLFILLVPGHSTTTVGAASEPSTAAIALSTATATVPVIVVGGVVRGLSPTDFLLRLLLLLPDRLVLGKFVLEDSHALIFLQSLLCILCRSFALCIRLEFALVVERQRRALRPPRRPLASCPDLFTNLFVLEALYLGGRRGRICSTKTTMSGDRLPWAQAHDSW